MSNKREEIISWLDNLVPEINRTGSPKDTFLKFANEKNLAPAELEMLGQVFNSAKTLQFLEKSANRGETFDVLDVEDMITEYTSYPTDHLYDKTGGSKSKQATLQKAASKKIKAGDSLPAIGYAYPEVKREEDPGITFRNKFAKLSRAVNDAEHNINETNVVINRTRKEAKAKLDWFTNYAQLAHVNLDFESLEKNAKYVGQCQEACDLLTQALKRNHRLEIKRASDAGERRLLSDEESNLATRVIELQKDLDFMKNAADLLNDFRIEKDQKEKEFEELKKSASMFPDLDDVTLEVDKNFNLRNKPYSKQELRNIKERERNIKERERIEAETERQRGDRQTLERERQEAKQQKQMLDQFNIQLKKTEEKLKDKGGKFDKNRKKLEKEKARLLKEKAKLNKKGPMQRLKEYGTEQAQGFHSTAFGNVFSPGRRTMVGDLLAESVRDPSYNPMIRQKGVDQQLDKSRMEAAFDELILTDPILQDEDEEELREHFETIRSVAPLIAKDKNVLRVVLREAAQYQGVQPHTLQGLVELQLNKNRTTELDRQFESEDYANPRRMRA